MRCKTVSGADCDHAISVAWVSNTESRVTLERSVLGLKALITEITGSGTHPHTTLNQPLGFVANRGASASEVTHVMRNRQAQVRTMNREISVPLVQVTQILKRRDDREFGVFQRFRKHTKVVEIDVGTHSISKGRAQLLFAV